MLVVLIDVACGQDQGEAASDEEGNDPGHVQPRVLSTPRTAAWRARKKAATALARAAKEAALQERLGDEAYTCLIARRLACKNRVARHRLAHASLGEEP
jgi:hypothetical protein